MLYCIYIIKNRLKWFNKDELLYICKKIVTPPTCTTIRIKHLVNQSIEDTLGKNIISLLKQQETSGFTWNIEVSNELKDLIILRPSITINKQCKQIYPRVAVDQYAAASIMRGADLMGVGVIGLDYGEE